MKTVLIFGTFDFLHSGHIHTFSEAKKLAERLVVSVARDRAVEAIKGKAPIHTEDERLALVRHIDLVDDAFLGDEEQGVYSRLSDWQPDIIALGYDQHALHKNLSAYMNTQHRHIPIVQLSSYNPSHITSSAKKKALSL